MVSSDLRRRRLRKFRATASSKYLHIPKVPGSKTIFYASFSEDELAKVTEVVEKRVEALCGKADAQRGHPPLR